jgi:hypothetical protein
VKQLADYTIHYHYPQFEHLPFDRQALEEGLSEKADKENPLPPIDISKNKYAGQFSLMFDGCVRSCRPYREHGYDVEWSFNIMFKVMGWYLPGFSKSAGSNG